MGVTPSPPFATWQVVIGGAGKKRKRKKRREKKIRRKRITIFIFIRAKMTIIQQKAIL